jgi:DNA-binding XRE family transcriptional regulator
MMCPSCGAVINIEELVASVKGRKAVRAALQNVDHRSKPRPPLLKNPGGNVLSRVIARLARMREEACLSQALMAQELGLSEWTVHRWEHNGRGAGVDECVRWARALGTTLETILKEVGA